MILRDATQDNSAELWHCRMGHVNFESLRHLARVADGIRLSPGHRLPFCECCVVLPSGPRQVFGVDVTGPYHTSPSGYRFCLEVVDYFSGYGYSFLMRLKSEAYRHFMALILRLENAEIYPRWIYGYVSDHGGVQLCPFSFRNSCETEVSIGKQPRGKHLIIMQLSNVVSRPRKGS